MKIFWENKNVYQSNKLMRTIIVLIVITDRLLVNKQKNKTKGREYEISKKWIR